MMPGKILIAWFGSFKNMSTVGDFLSVKVLSEFLELNQYHFDSLCHGEFEGIRGKIISPEEMHPEDYSTIIFCCGPMNINNKRLTALMERFQGQYKIAVGVSLFPAGHPNYYNPFDALLAREYGGKDYVDLAILDHGTPKKHTGRKALKIGMVLRNHQKDYGSENCFADQANAALLKIAKAVLKKKSFFGHLKALLQREEPIVTIDNQLYQSGLSSEEIERQYQECGLILTTRFHGAIIALRNGIPVIALDQINKGAKVFHLLSILGYPYVWKINEFDSNQVLRSALKIIKRKHRKELDQFVETLRERAKQTLSDLDKILRGI